MTDTTKLLALAKPVYPDGMACVGDVYCEVDGEVCALKTNVVRVRDNRWIGGWVQFDPANNSDQALAVLAWLVRTKACMSFHGGKHCVSSGEVHTDTHDNSNDFQLHHDGTAAGLRKAVTEAGMRLVG